MKTLLIWSMLAFLLSILTAIAKPKHNKKEIFYMWYSFPIWFTLHLVIGLCAATFVSYKKSIQFILNKPDCKDNC